VQEIILNDPSPGTSDKVFLASNIAYQLYCGGMAWEVEVTGMFERWWNGLNESEREDVRATVGLLEARGPALPFPYSSAVVTSKYAQMRELRIQHKGRPYRVLYAFDPRRMALLLIGGDKTGSDRWYEENVPIADKLFAQHLTELKQTSQSKRRR
jgi:hypothetical protein